MRGCIRVVVLVAAGQFADGRCGGILIGQAVSPERRVGEADA